jgi:methyl-accepting chemotaxis protein
MGWYKNLKIGAKLITAFLILAVIAGVIGVVGILNIDIINSNSQRLYDKNTVGLSYCSDASTFYQRMRFNALDLATTGDDAERTKALGKITDFMAQADDALTSMRR